MTRRSTTYPALRFPHSVYEESLKRLEEYLSLDDSGSGTLSRPSSLLSTIRGPSRYYWDSEAEFFAEKSGAEESFYSVNPSTAFHYLGTNLKVEERRSSTEVSIEVNGGGRDVVENAFMPFDDYSTAHPAVSDSVIAPLIPRVFVGHGGSSPDWRELVGLLRDRHGLDVSSFESGARAGHTVRDVIERELGKASFAVLIHSAEDRQEDETLRARQNVVHEAGLFQGHLGWNRAIVLVERGAQLYSNLDGIQHISYRRGEISAAVGEVLATIRREFG